jgi:SH3 domain-containing YSC84-like protein 1
VLVAVNGSEGNNGPWGGREKHKGRFVKILIVTLALSCAIPVFAQKDAAERLQASAEVMNEIMAISDKGIPQDLLSKSECIAVIPNAKKASFIVGAKYGRGFLSCRRKDDRGWSAPGAIRTEGGSFGFQAGGAETDVVMLVLNRKGAERLTSSKFTLGGDVSVAAGPVGRDSQAATDASFMAKILTYSRQRGIFAGVSLSGATIREDDTANRELYGHEVKNRTLVDDSSIPVPAAAKSFIATLNKYSPRK